MENSTVQISLEYYNRLRDFHTEAIKNKIPVFETNDGLYNRSRFDFYTIDESIKKIAEINEKMERENLILETENEQLINNLDNVMNLNKKYEINNLNEMNLWQIIIWKIRNK